MRRKRWQLCGLAVLSSGAAWAQDVGGGAAPGYSVVPRFTVSQALSSNANGADGGRSEQVTQISPGVQIISNNARVQGFLDYSLNGFYRAQGTAGDSVQHALNASAKVNAYDNRAFVDMSAVMSQNLVSAFGPLPAGPFDGQNQAQTTTLHLSPYITGLLPGGMSYEARYNLQTTHADTAVRADSTSQNWSARLGRPGGNLGWSVDASQQHFDFSGGQKSSLSALSANLYHPFSSQLQGTVFGGAEWNDVISAKRTRYDNFGLGLDWRPSDRSTVSVNVSDRYFGTGYSVLLEQRGARTVWRYSDSRSAVNTPADMVTASLGNLYDLLNSMYLTLEPDQVRRAQLVQADLQRLGLPADTQVRRNFLLSSSTLQRNQQLSLILFGARDSITFALSRSDMRRLQSGSSMGDDFDLASSIQSQGWNVAYAHRLTPVTTLTASFNSMQNQGSGSQLNSSVRTFSLVLGTRLGVRTTASVQLGRSVYDNAGKRTSDTPLVANITHNFF